MNSFAGSMVSRRVLLQGAAAAAGAFLARSTFAVDVAADDLGGLNVGVQSSSFSAMSLDAALGAMKNDLKVGAAEICPDHLSGLSAAQASDKLKASGIKPVSYGCGPFSSSMDDNRKIFEYAKAIGFTNISGDPDPAAFDSLDKLTDEYKITVAVRDRGPTYRWAMIDELSTALKNHSKMIGLCNDTGEFFRVGEDPVRACEVFKDRLYAIHLRDFTLIKGNYEPCIIGQGNLELTQLVRLLIKNNYKGGVFLEYDGNDPVEKIQASLDRLKDAVKKVQSEK